MTNTIDLFQSDCHALALPAATIAVFVEGSFCEDLAPVEIVRGPWPEFSWARLEARAIAPEQIEERFVLGTEVRLCQLYNGTPPEVALAALPLFVGHMETIETRIGGDAAAIKVVAKDLSAALQRITVYGQRVCRDDDATLLLPGLETVFNPLAAANAAPEAATLDGKTRTVFSTGAGRAKAWTCAEVIQYLLCEYASQRPPALAAGRVPASPHRGPARPRSRSHRSGSPGGPAPLQ